MGNFFKINGTTLAPNDLGLGKSHISACFSAYLALIPFPQPDLFLLDFCFSIQGYCSVLLSTPLTNRLLDSPPHSGKED